MTLPVPEKMPHITGLFWARVLFTERSCAASYYVFSKKLIASGDLTPIEFEICKRMLSIFESLIEVETINVMLFCNPQVALNRIRKRNRPGESGISNDLHLCSTCR